MVQSIHSQCPNMDACVSFLEINSSIKARMSIKSRTSWWTWQTATEFRCSCVIVLRSQVFSLRSALNAQLLRTKHVR